MDEAKSYRAYEEQDANDDDRMRFVAWLLIITIVALLVGFGAGYASHSERECWTLGTSSMFPIHNPECR